LSTQARVRGEKPASFPGRVAERAFEIAAGLQQGLHVHEVPQLGTAQERGQLVDEDLVGGVDRDRCAQDLGPQWRLDGNRKARPRDR
jgi:hypothetical protein